MASLSDLVQQGTTHAWLFIPTAILLGALHGLEPGHSKTMMAAFIIAIQGTVMQAVLLGVSAAISHTAVVWLVALGGQYLGRSFNADTTEPYFQVASAVIILAIAAWMIWRTWREQRGEADHHHHHGDEDRHINTGHGGMTLEVFEDGVPPRWRACFEGHAWAAADVMITTRRDNGAEQTFTFADRGGYLESVEEIPEPHVFKARINLGHAGHSHAYDLVFEEHGHGHDHHHDHALDLTAGGKEALDAHAQAHANDIQRRFAGRIVTTGQIAMFGLTGGLIPCPAAITVLLLCLQLKQLSLGVVLVLCFSIGLAITMVSAGVLASISIRHIQTRWSGFSAFVSRAPYASGALMILIALYMGITGGMALHAV